MIFKRKKSVPSHPHIDLGGRVTERDGERHVALNAPKYLQHFLKEYAKVGDIVSIKITAKRPTRTLSQNSFMHVYFNLIALSSGHTMMQIKSWAKGMFLTKGITEVFGHKTRDVKDTHNLNIGECVEFMNRIEDKTGIPIPDPEPFGLGLTLDEYGHLKEIQTAKYKKMKPKGIKMKMKKKKG